MMQLGQRIQTLRRNKRMTQAQLAEVLAVSPQSVSKWETGMSVPDVALLPVIARYFGITMDELFGYRLDALTCREQFIRFMADNGVLRLGGEYPLRCGRRSPYCIDTGRYQSASQIARLGAFYAQCLRENNVETNLLLSNEACEVPMLIATSLALHDRWGMDVRYSVDNKLGRCAERGDRVTLVKDTLTTGASLWATLQQLVGSEGVCVSDVIVSVDRMERGQGMLCAKEEIEQAFGVRIHAIVSAEDIIRAVENGVIGGAEHLDAMRSYLGEHKGVYHGH